MGENKSCETCDWSECERAKDEGCDICDEHTSSNWKPKENKADMSANQDIGGKKEVKTMPEVEYGCKIMEALAQSYCSKENEQKVLDNDLIVEMASRLLPLIKELLSEKEKALDYALKLNANLCKDIEALKTKIEFKDAEIEALDLMHPLDIKQAKKEAILEYDKELFNIENAIDYPLNGEGFQRYIRFMKNARTQALENFGVKGE